MDEAFLAIIRDVGPVGILALALLGVARGLRPALEAVAQAQRDSADARREQSKTNEAVLKRWEDSDRALAENRKQHIDALSLVTARLEDLHITHTQRIKQNDIIHGVVNGLNQQVQELPGIFETGKNDAVDKVVSAMSEKLTPIEEKLTHIASEQERLTRELQDLLQEIRASRQPEPPKPDTPKAGAPGESEGAQTDAGAE